MITACHRAFPLVNISKRTARRGLGTMNEISICASSYKMMKVET